MNNKKSSILITGAGKRIGAALTEHLAAQGHALVLHYSRSKQEAEALAAHLKKNHRIEVTLVQADLADSGALKGFWKGLPPCHAIIHNAAMFERDTVDSFTADGLQQHLAVNLQAPLLLTQGFLAQLPKGITGSVVVLGDGSLGASLGPQFFSYAVSKHAWASVIELLAATLAPRARANLVRPGPTLPGLHDDAAVYGRLAERTPLKRISAPEEICAAVDYFLNAPSVTGQVLSLSGGMHLPIAKP